ncbi:MAG TPA: hypothetical protein VGK73_39415 [Polyangiaceae bacterium]
MRKPTREFFFLAVTVTLACVARPASAGDSKLVGGSFCRKVGSANTNVAVSDTQGDADGLLNGTASPERVACPLVRDSADEAFTAVFARLVDRTPPGKAPYAPRCRMHGLSSNGTRDSSEWVPHGNPTSGSAPHFDSLSVVDEFDVALNGSASVECDLGGFDTILGLRWEEDTATASNDIKVVAGNACYSTDYLSTTLGTAHAYGYFDVPTLPFDQHVFAQCPIVRDNSSEPLLGAWVRIVVPAGETGSCWLETRSVNGETFGNTDWALVPDEGTGSIYLDPDDVTAHFSQGAYWVACAMPDNSRILSIRTDEL